MKHNIFRFSSFFCLGFLLYPLIEVIWRGRTHLSMAFLGGLSAVAIVFIDSQMKRGFFLQKAALSALVITQMEWIFGVVLNLKMKLGIWDYSGLPFNLAGQVCLLFSFYWFLLSLSLILILDLEKEYGRRMAKRKNAH